MSYAQAASRGAQQSPEEIEVADSDTTNTSLIDVDSPHVSSVPSTFESQENKNHHPGRARSRSAERERERERERELCKDKDKGKRKAGKEAATKTAVAKAKLSRNITNPVILGNALFMTFAGTGLGFGAYQKHIRGALTWRVIGMWSGIVGAVVFVDYFVSKWFFQNKYPTNRESFYSIRWISQWAILFSLRWCPLHGYFSDPLRILCEASPSGCLYSPKLNILFFYRSSVPAQLNLRNSITMNSLFNAALKQSSALRRDLDAFSEAPTTTSPAVQGQISASLTSFSRTIDDYSSLSKQELIPAKQELAFERLKNFRTELADYRQLFDRLKKEREDAQSTSNRNELLGRRPHHASTPENPYAQSNLPQSSPFANPNYSHHRPSPSGSLGFNGVPTDYTRETHTLREHSFLSSTNMQLDEFIGRGRAVLGDLGQQREILKGTQRRLYSVANTLGVSGDTIRTIERRAKQDKWIFWGGVVVFFLFCWAVLHFLT
ncbi:hypothetical protein PABG_05084 [Paracoccidioides brasiliensis Pb03]|nr:hypothetical protein PABG_05084 [Paracoccidioides brasiliensis Pb03]